MEHRRGGRRKPATVTALRFRAPVPVEEIAGSLAARRGRRAGGRSRALLVVLAIWALGLIALVLVVEFQERLDATRLAQDLTSEMVIQRGALLQIIVSASSSAIASRWIDISTATPPAPARRTGS